jgi:hypothetical protein
MSANTKLSADSIPADSNAADSIAANTRLMLSASDLRVAYGGNTALMWQATSVGPGDARRQRYFKV